jgi:adenylate cyclase
VTSADQIVDITIDPAQQRRQRRRDLIRVGLPIVGVALVIVTIAAIAVQTTRANQEGVLALSDELLTSLQDRVSLQVYNWLEPARRALITARDLAGRQGATAQSERAVAFAASTLRQEPEIAQFSFADSDGNFLLVRRGDAGGTDVKTIRMTPPPRETVWIHRDATGREIGRETDPKDDYDARGRPWFTGATASSTVFWTPVYVFFTDKTPGITAAITVPDNPNRSDVVGVDIYLRDLARFLSTLAIGKTGQAAIVDRSGEPVAATNALDRTLLASAWDRFRLEGPGHRIIEVNGRRIVTMAEPLSVSGVDWNLVIIVPADEFTGFLVAHNRTALLMSAIIVGMALVLAILLVRQGIRADRATATARERAALLATQSAAYAQLAIAATAAGPQGEPSPDVMEILSETTAARRASLWAFAAGGTLRCLDMYERAGHGHTDSLELARQEVPRFAAALSAAEPVVAPDALTDPRPPNSSAPSCSRSAAAC